MSAPRTVLYARVSTTDQNISIQKAQAENAGFVIDEVVADEGVSGVSTRLQDRPEGKRLFDLLRRDDTLVVRWVDRLGRNYSDVTDAIRRFMNKGVIIRTVINDQTYDGSETDITKKAVRDALIGFMAATAQAQAEATKESQLAGIAAAKAEHPQRYRGKKPRFDREQLAAIQDMLAMNKGASAISKHTGVSRQTILRIKNNPDAAMAMLHRWNL